MHCVLVQWIVLGFCLIGSVFVSLFLVERIMQQPIPVSLHFQRQLIGVHGGEPFGDWVGVLDVLLESLLCACYDNLCSSYNPVCKFGCGCFIQQSLWIPWKQFHIFNWCDFEMTPQNPRSVFRGPACLIIGLLSKMIAQNDNNERNKWDHSL